MISKGKTEFCLIVFAPDMLALCTRLVFAITHTVYVAMYKLLNTPCVVIGITGDIKNVDEEFRNWLDNNVLDI